MDKDADYFCREDSSKGRQRVVDPEPVRLKGLGRLEMYTAYMAVADGMALGGDEAFEKLVSSGCVVPGGGVMTHICRW